MGTESEEKVVLVLKELKPDVQAVRTMHLIRTKKKKKFDHLPPVDEQLFLDDTHVVLPDLTVYDLVPTCRARIVFLKTTGAGRQWNQEPPLHVPLPLPPPQLFVGKHHRREASGMHGHSIYNRP